MDLSKAGSQPIISKDKKIVYVAIVAGGYDYLVKPFDIRELRLRIKKGLER